MTRPVGVPILTYHALSGSRTPGFRRWTLLADRFEAHLDYLKITATGLSRSRNWPAGALTAGPIPVPGSSC